MNFISNCPKCGNSNFTKVFDCKDYTVSQKEFTVNDCQKCSFRFTNPIPTEEEIGKFYESDEYISHSNTSRGLVNGLYQAVRKITLKQKCRIVRDHSPGKTIVDIGSGTGEFLNQWIERGGSGIGIEPSEKAKEKAIANYKLTIEEESYLDKIEAETIDAISMWHVLEHVYHLNARIKQIGKVLRVGGVAIIAVPNFMSYDAQKYKECWAAYDVPRHLYHFREEDVVSLFSKEGFKHINTLPMKFDSFYVSMLSEKYKKGKGSLLSAFFTGLLSNLRAGKKGLGYSSQIYILQKQKNQATLKP